MTCQLEGCVVSPGKRPTERDAELRGQIPKELLQLIDAVMQAKGYQSRMDVVIPIMWDHVEEELHRATLLLRMAGINPMASESREGAPR